MGTEYFGGYHWKGYNKPLSSQIDESVWLVNEGKTYNKEDYRVYLYLFKDIKKECVFKFGISSYPNLRLKNLNSDCWKLGHQFEMMESVLVGERRSALLVESVVLKQFPRKLYRRSVFPGATEVFLSNNSEVMEVFRKTSVFISKNKIV